MHLGFVHLVYSFGNLLLYSILTIMFLIGKKIECSYDSSRPAHLMFGHLSPPGLYQELKTLAGFVSKSKK